MMKNKKMRLGFMVLFLVFSGVFLLQTSQKVREAERKLAKMERAIAAEEERLRVLRAEWAYLSAPQNLEILAGEYLDLVPPTHSDIYTHSSTLPIPPQLYEYDPLLHAISITAEEGTAYVTPPRKPLASMKRGRP